MNKEIQELIDLVVKSDTKLSEILRRVLLLATQYDKEIIPWIKQEMDGYEFGANYPQYRYVYGHPQAKKPNSGQWVPFDTRNEKLQITISKIPIIHSIANLESWIKPDQDMYLPYSESLQEDFSKLSGTRTTFALCITNGSIIEIFNKVRNKLLDWLSNLSPSVKNTPNITSDNVIFPQGLISQLPNDMKLLADDFNFNYSNERPYTCMLILRRILPLSIVRKYQQDGKEADIKNDNDEYISTKELLGKAHSLVGKTPYNKLLSHKMLLDASQHSYGFRPEISEVHAIANALRIFLDEIF